MKIKILLKETSDEQKTKVIRAFIRARDTNNIKQLVGDLKNAGFEDPLQAIKILNTDEEDSEFYQSACEQHNNMARDLGRSEEIMNIDAFSHFPKIVSNPNKSPDPYGMRNPKLKTMGESNMKITKEYLKQIIIEEVQSLLEEEEDLDPEDPKNWKDDEDDDKEHPDPLHPSHWKEKKKKDS